MILFEPQRHKGRKSQAALLLCLLPGLFSGFAVAAETTTLTVAASRSACVGVGPRRCLQVKRAGSERFELFYDTIDGFDFQPGYQYQLRVRITEVADPPADASNLRYQLVNIIDKAPASNDPEQALWVLQRYIVDGAMQSVPDGVRATLELIAGRATGSTGCNHYAGSYQRDGEQLSIDPGGITQRACPGPQMTVETGFLAALGRVTSLTDDDGQMQLNDADGKPLLSFVAEPPLTLSSVEWQLQSYNNQRGGLVSSRGSEHIDAVFGADGKVSGSSGCNRYHGSYKLNGDTIRLSSMPATRRMCAEPAGIMDDEQGFLAAMASADHYSIHDRRLTFYNSEGTRQLVFRPKP